MSKFNSLSLSTKVLINVAVACLICGITAISVAVYYNDVAFRDGLASKARTIHGRLDVAAMFVANQGGLEPMIERYTSKYNTSHELTEEDKSIILQQVPIYAAMKIGSEGAEEENYEFRVFSDEPRNQNNQATSSEMEVFNRFKKDTTLEEIVEDNSTHVIVYRPVRLKKSHGCLTCHGNPSTSPWGNGKDILGYQMENWEDGKLHGVFAVKSEVAAVLVAKAEAGDVSSTPFLVGFIFLGGILALFLAWVMLKKPIAQIASVVDDLGSAEMQLVDTSGNLARNSMDLSTSSNQQASAIQETSSSLNEITSMVNKTTESARAAADLASKSREKAQQGEKVISEMVKSMNEIDSSNQDIMAQVNDSNTKMNQILGVIKEIGEKTRVINDIVFQTKLLSFNASVEAARAGESGKGFAVVAEEVGNLAQMSGEAADQITEMIDQSFQRVDTIVNETKTKVDVLAQQGSDKIEKGVSKAKECGEVFGHILSDVSEVTEMAVTISSANKEQSAGISEINRAVSELDDSTKKNTVMSQESAKSSGMVSEQANSVKVAVSSLRGVVFGGSKEPVESGQKSKRAA